MPQRGWRALQVTTLVGALRRPVPARGRGAAPEAGLASGSIPGASSGADAAAVAAIRARARWAGLSAPACEVLAERWPTLPDVVRQQIAAPWDLSTGQHVWWGADVAAQVDGTTCGSAALAMLAAAGDPALALWLASGEELPGAEVPEIRYVRRLLPGAAVRTPRQRFAAMQRAIKHVTNRLGTLGWPAALGTPPWGAVRAARFGPVRFAGELVDDGDRRRTAQQLDRAGASLDRGIPVPMYVQGDLGGGLAHTVPRHVVLLTGRSGEDVVGYEPARGIVVRLPWARLLEPAGPRPELGGWTHVAWLLLPRGPRTVRAGCG